VAEKRGCLLGSEASGFWFGGKRKGFWPFFLHTALQQQELETNSIKCMLNWHPISSFLGLKQRPSSVQHQHVLLICVLDTLLPPAGTQQNKRHRGRPVCKRRGACPHKTKSLNLCDQLCQCHQLICFIGNWVFIFASFSWAQPQAQAEISTFLASVARQSLSHLVEKHQAFQDRAICLGRKFVDTIKSPPLGTSAFF